MQSIIGALCLLLAAWFLQGQRSSIRRHGKRLPRPPGTLPLAGNGIWFLQPRHRLLSWFSERERRVGFETYEISVPSLPPAVVINDPRNVEYVLRHNETFVKGHQFRQRSWDLFGNGIINADGELWRIQRKAGLRFFSNANLKAFVDDVLPSLLGDTKAKLGTAAHEGKIVDVEAMMLDLTTRLMGNIAFNMDIDSSLPFSKCFDLASGAIGDRFQNPFWKVKELFYGGAIRRAVFEVKRFGATIVSNAATRSAQSGSGDDRKVGRTDTTRSYLIDSLLDHISDKSVVADAAMNYLSAGRDTMAQSLTWTFYMLMRHSHVQKAVLRELDKALGGSIVELDCSWDLVNSGALTYTFAVFNETLRLYPPVPIELKESTADSELPDGTELPVGAVVMWIPWAMGRSKLIWGHDVDSFRPERWLVDESTHHHTLVSKSAFEFPVFNGGPRSCLGKKMAESVGLAILAGLLKSYRFEEAEDRPLERHSQNSLTLPMAGGLPCRVFQRSNFGLKS